MHSERKEELISSFRVQRTLGYLFPVDGLSVTFQTVNQDIVPGTFSKTLFFFFFLICIIKILVSLQQVFI